MCRRHTWRPLAATAPTKQQSVHRAGLLATFSALAELVDAFAIVKFIRQSVPAYSSNDMLRPVSVLLLPNGSYALLFKTASATFPLQGVAGSLLHVAGSHLALTFVEDSPVAERKMLKLPTSSNHDDVQACAAQVSAKLIGECVSNAEAHKSFRDAVDSRFKFFAKLAMCSMQCGEVGTKDCGVQRARIGGSATDGEPAAAQAPADGPASRESCPGADQRPDADCLEAPGQTRGGLLQPPWDTEVPAAHWLGEHLACSVENNVPAENAPREHTSKTTTCAFVKPDFHHLDELLCAFATHAIDERQETFLLPFTGCENLACSPQPLVFCHNWGK